ncbi:MAG TPA: hypothetical protein VFU69_11565 [Ktedonobacterales bacterium]|nr:hypothetical protein [Ktedonobacterales bacterium]
MARPKKPKPFPFSLPACVAFWQAVWVAPLAALGDPYAGAFRFAVPRWPVVLALGPLWLQRQVAAAVAKRLAWQRQTGWHVPWQYLFYIASIGWEGIAKDGIALETREEMEEDFLRWFLGLQLETLLYLLEGKGALEEAYRLRAIVGCCWRIALLYREACRRYHQAQARIVVLEELRCFLGHLAQTA